MENRSALPPRKTAAQSGTLFQQNNLPAKHAQNGPESGAAAAAGSERWSGQEDAASPLVPGTRAGSQASGTSSDSRAMQDNSSSARAGSESAQANQSTQSDSSLSRTADDNSAEDGRFNVAEEVSLDQQSDATRRVGQVPQGDGNGRAGTGASASETIGKAIQNASSDGKH